MHDVADKTTQDFFEFSARVKVLFTLGPARLAQLLDYSAETGSLRSKNNPTLTMFPQKDFIWSR
jgi:hypothetical protein